ncbi:unnamed protein product [Lactuca virosa]|uniref:Pentatricopeptide repeat-containing protein n=1 Tax=Lactuca virosa TaxID=75947 RepID=A0AAU9LD67_9ASTR|nr:unnamed protein product [Lactuca virosa]
MYTAKLITRLCNSCLTDTAVTVLEEVVGMGWKPSVDTYTMVIDNLFDRGRVDYALKLFKYMALHHGILPDVDSYSFFLRAIRMLSRRDDISKLLKDMEDEGNYVGPETFNVFVDAYCKEGRMEDAESLVKLMNQRRICPAAVIYKSLIDGYCLKGNMSKSREVFDLMSHRGVFRDVAVYNSLLKGYCEDSKVEEAIPLFHEMMQSSVKHNTEEFNEVPKPDEYTYFIMLWGLCNNNQVEEAVSLFQSNKKFNLNISVYNMLIHGANKNGKLDIARSLYNEMTVIKGLQPNDMTYVAMINGFCEQGLAAEAKEWFLEMKEKGLWPNEATCTILLIGFRKTKQLDLVEMLLLEMEARGYESAKPMFSGPGPFSSLSAKEGMVSL